MPFLVTDNDEKNIISLDRMWLFQIELQHGWLYPQNFKAKCTLDRTQSSCKLKDIFKDPSVKQTNKQTKKKQTTHLQQSSSAHALHFHF